MKKLTALLLCLVLFLCSCGVPAAQIVSSAESSMAASSVDVSSEFSSSGISTVTGESVTKQLIDTNGPTEEKAYKKIYVYNTEKQNYTTSLSSRECYFPFDYIVELEDIFGRPLFVVSLLPNSNKLMEVCFDQVLITRRFSPQQEQAILYSITRTLLEYESDVDGVCFQMNSNAGYVPYCGSISFIENEMCVPPGTSPIGQLSFEQAQNIAEQKIADLSANELQDMKQAKYIVNLHGARYINQTLCYIYEYCSKVNTTESAKGLFALDTESGSKFFSWNEADGGFILVSDDNEKLTMPATK